MPTLKNYVALLRGINVGGKARVPMKELRQLCSSLGWTDVRTWLQSGNVLFKAPGPTGPTGPTGLESMLEAGITSRFDLKISVIVRDAATLKAHLSHNPFEKAAREDPSHLLLYLSKRLPEPTAVDYLHSKAKAGEVMALQGEALWIHFPNGIGTSKITPSVVDRAVGSPATGRNWNTLTKLCE